MSHFTTIRTKITDLNVLKKCLEEMGYSLEEGELRIKGYAGTTECVDLRISLSDEHGLGFRRSDDGTYELIADWWGITSVDQESLEDQIRTIEKQILQEYACEKVLREAKKHGWIKAKSERQPDGSIRIDFVKH